MSEKDKIEAHNTPSNDSPDIESTDFAAENSDCTPDDPLASAIAAFVDAQEQLSGASSMLVAATYDLAHHYETAVEHKGVVGALMRRLPDDIMLRDLRAEALIDRRFLEEIIVRLAGVRNALNMVVKGAPADDDWGICCWIGKAYFMPISDVWRIPTFVLYIQDYRDIIDFFDHPDACDKGNCGFYERQFADFTVLFYTDPQRLLTDFPSAWEVGWVCSCDCGVSIDFSPGVVLNKELSKKVFGTLPPPWLNSISATLSLKLCLRVAPPDPLHEPEAD